MDVKETANDTASWRQWLLEGGDADLLEAMGWLLLSVGALLVVLNILDVKTPYGKHSNAGGVVPTLILANIKVPAKVGWFLMEMPSFVIPLYLILNVGGKYVGEFNPNIALLGMFILHYFNR